MNEINIMFIDTLKVKLKSVIVLTSSIEVVDDDNDLNDHNHIPCPTRDYDHVSFIEQKIVHDTLMIEISVSMFP